MCSTPAEALKKLIEEYVLVNYKPEPWHSWRKKYLWRTEENNILEANLENLRKIYASFHTPVKRWCEFSDIAQIFTQRIPDFGMMEESVRFCFGMCKMPVSVESQEWKKYGRLEFVEFLELIGRVAEYKFRLETELPLY